MILAVASLVFAVVPMGIYLWLVWLMDRYDREPISLLLKNFLWGAFGAILFGILFSIAFSSALGSNDFQNAIYIAPFVEELAKASFLLLVTVRDRRFDNVTDGVVYGMAIGLGFGMTENFLYFIGAKTVGDWVMLVVMRTLFSAVMHSMSTGIFGAFVGFTKFQARALRWPLRLLGIALAMLLHFFWNYSVSIDDPGAIGAGMLAILFSVAAIIVLVQVALLWESRMIHQELAEEVEQGAIPAVHLNYLPYSSKRRLIGWLPITIDKKDYIALTTRLAFRKFQSRHCAERERPGYLLEVESLREEIRGLLERERVSPSAQLF